MCWFGEICSSNDTCKMWCVRGTRSQDGLVHDCLKVLVVQHPDVYIVLRDRGITNYDWDVAGYLRTVSSPF